MSLTMPLTIGAPIKAGRQSMCFLPLHLSALLR